MAMVSGFSTLIWISGLNFGCAWFCEGLTVLVVWMLCRMPSLFFKSIVLPAGKTSTIDVKNSDGILHNIHKIGRHTSELQSPYDLVCRLLLAKTKQDQKFT